jgi:hypothetical protein
MRHLVARFPVGALGEFRSTTSAADGTRRQPARTDLCSTNGPLHITDVERFTIHVPIRDLLRGRRHVAPSRTDYGAFLRTTMDAALSFQPAATRQLVVPVT